MRTIHIEDKLRLRFPHRDESFCDGVEIGIVAALMGLGLPQFSRSVSASNVEQVRALARRLGYHVTACEGQDSGAVRVTVRDRPQAPTLRLVHSAAR